MGVLNEDCTIGFPRTHHVRTDGVWRRVFNREIQREGKEMSNRRFLIIVSIFTLLFIMFGGYTWYLILTVGLPTIVGVCFNGALLSLTAVGWTMLVYQRGTLLEAKQALVETKAQIQIQQDRLKEAKLLVDATRERANGLATKLEEAIGGRRTRLDEQLSKQSDEHKLIEARLRGG